MANMLEPGGKTTSNNNDNEKMARNAIGTARITTRTHSCKSSNYIRKCAFDAIMVMVIVKENRVKERTKQNKHFLW